MKILTTLLLLFFGSGCIRISGGAGYWKKGSTDEPAQVKQIGFDTQDLQDYIPGAPAPGSIEVAE